MRLQVVPTQARPAVSDYCERACVFSPVCGGTADFALWGCMSHCCGGELGCDHVCPRNPEFAEAVAQVNGLRFGDLAQIVQRQVDLPLYVPHLNHRYGRRYPLDWPIVSITPYDLFRLSGDDVYTAKVDSPAGLRSHFRLSAQARLILKGTAKDRRLERYWAYRFRDGAPQRLAQLGIDLVIGPNFTHFVDLPKTVNLYNRKRQLICLEELQAAGLNVAPHLNDTGHADWDYWRDFLRANPGIKYVAKEFQTGNKPRLYASAVLHEIEVIQQEVGRPLHPILIGGAGLADLASEQFRSFTVLDSRPFMNAVKRQAFAPAGRKANWRSEPTLPKCGIDGLVHSNVRRYSTWLASRVSAHRAGRRLGDRQAV
jgi:hypothetical protein